MIPYGRHHIDDEDIQAVVDVLRSSYLTQGPAIERFEKAITDYTGSKFAVAVSSGTAALHLAALAAGVGPETAIVTTPISFVASANGALYTGGDVLFADIDPLTVNMSPLALNEVLQSNRNVKAVVPVHFAGLPCDMPAIKAAADRIGAVVIEDAAHAMGAFYPDNKRVGCCEHSLMTVFSFHPVKAIAAGEGGVITTNDAQTYRKLLRLRSHGINKLDDPLQRQELAFTNGRQNPWYYEMQELGFNYRITDIQSALALSQMRKLDQFMERRRYLVRRYDQSFLDCDYVKPAQPVDKGLSGNHLYVIRVDSGTAKLDRGQLMTQLRQLGIGSQVHYIPIPAQPYYRRLGHNAEHYPEAMHYYNEALSIPLFFDLTDEEQDQVISAIRELLS